MQRMLLLLTALGLAVGCSKSGIMSPRAFTREYVEEFRQDAPRLKVVIVKDLELNITAPDGQKVAVYLHNAYDTYKQDPKGKGKVFRRYIATALETVHSLAEKVDRTRIVPVIKDRPWLEGTRQAMIAREKKPPENVFDDFSPDLVVVYAEDSPRQIRYLTREVLKETGVERSELRKLACENLRRLLPGIEIRGTNGLYAIRAGGDYE